MDDQQVGLRVRAARIRRGWRQRDLAATAGLSDVTVSRIERGHLGATSLDAIRRVAAALEIRVELLPRSRAGDLERLVNARHAALAESVVGRLVALGGWLVRPKVSFSVYGERGVIDLLAWHAGQRALLVVELKTEIVDVGEILGTLDRKRRLGARVGDDFGWRPATVSAWLIVGQGRTSRRRLVAHRATFDAALPDDGRTVRRWLRRPTGEVRAVSLWPFRHQGTVGPGFATVRRVRGRGPRSGEVQQLGPGA